MIGKLEKIDNHWVIRINDEQYPLHPIDVEGIAADSLICDNIEGKIAFQPMVMFKLVNDTYIYGKIIHRLETVSDNELIAIFMKGMETKDLGVQAWDFNEHNGLIMVLMYDISWDWLMPVIRKINGLGKEYQFSIFKTYVSCTVEKNGKFYKDFSFSHAEYITSEQTDLEAAYKLVIRFLRWYYSVNVSS